jgi:RNA polymerase sigma factor (TIGR02999 family)
MNVAPDPEITRILLELSAPEADRDRIQSQLYEAVYSELRRVAGGLMRRERNDHTLQPTALVHEAYLRLVDQSLVRWENRAHFFGIAARAMRQILVDYARRHNAQKRGGDLHRVTLEENLADSGQLSYEILALHEALERLEAEDPRMAQVVELRVFAGMFSREVAHALGVSKRTVDADWKFACMWLSREMSESEAL